MVNRISARCVLLITCYVCVSRNMLHTYYIKHLFSQPSVALVATNISLCYIAVVSVSFGSHQYLIDILTAAAVVNQVTTQCVLQFRYMLFMGFTHITSLLPKLLVAANLLLYCLVADSVSFKSPQYLIDCQTSRWQRLTARCVLQIT